MSWPAGQAGHGWLAGWLELGLGSGSAGKQTRPIITYIQPSILVPIKAKCIHIHYSNGTKKTTLSPTASVLQTAADPAVVARALELLRKVDAPPSVHLVVRRAHARRVVENLTLVPPRMSTMRLNSCSQRASGTRRTRPRDSRSPGLTRASPRAPTPRHQTTIPARGAARRAASTCMSTTDCSTPRAIPAAGRPEPRAPARARAAPPGSRQTIERGRRGRVTGGRPVEPVGRPASPPSPDRSPGRRSGPSGLTPPSIPSAARVGLGVGRVGRQNSTSPASRRGRGTRNPLGAAASTVEERQPKNAAICRVWKLLSAVGEDVAELRPREDPGGGAPYARRCTPTTKVHRPDIRNSKFASPRPGPAPGLTLRRRGGPGPWRREFRISPQTRTIPSARARTAAEGEEETVDERARAPKTAATIRCVCRFTDSGFSGSAPLDPKHARRAQETPRFRSLQNASRASPKSTAEASRRRRLSRRGAPPPSSLFHPPQTPPGPGPPPPEFEVPLVQPWGPASRVLASRVFASRVFVAGLRVAGLRVAASRRAARPPGPNGTDPNETGPTTRGQREPRTQALLAGPVEDKDAAGEAREQERARDDRIRLPNPRLGRWCRSRSLPASPQVSATWRRIPAAHAQPLGRPRSGWSAASSAAVAAPNPVARSRRRA